ncbi:MAG: GatB/YqeY domain-containing protein [Deltaproteobacteria bacterium]|nr:GatB/YqeY domain-containing protein [Deltaproteobacteria bacterium]
MSLKEKLSQDIKNCMKTAQKDRLQYGRTLHAAIRKKEIDDRIDLNDADIEKIVSSLVKQRLDSIEQFGKGGRTDLVAKEKAELQFLQEYLPQQLTDEELRKVIHDTISDSKSQGSQDFGKVMKLLMPKVRGRTDGKKVSQLVKSLLG